MSDKNDQALNEQNAAEIKDADATVTVARGNVHSEPDPIEIERGDVPPLPN